MSRQRRVPKEDNSQPADLDWDRYSQDLEVMFAEVSSYRALNQGDYERHLAHVRTFGLVPSTFAGILERDLGIFEHDKVDSFWKEQWNSIRATFGLSYESPPSHIVPKPEAFKNWVDIAKSSIQDKRADKEFVRAWGKIHHAYGLFIGLRMRAGENEKLIANDVTGIADSALRVQEIWYAHWIFHNAVPFNEHSRIDAGYRLAELCVDISRGVKLPWGPYKVAWYETLINQSIPTYQTNYHDSPDSQSITAKTMLRERFSKISDKRLFKLAQDPNISITTIPPLSAAQFENSTPGGSVVQD